MDAYVSRAINENSPLDEADDNVLRYADYLSGRIMETGDPGAPVAFSSSKNAADIVFATFHNDALRAGRVETRSPEDAIDVGRELINALRRAGREVSDIDEPPPTALQAAYVDKFLLRRLKGEKFRKWFRKNMPYSYKKVHTTVGLGSGPIKRIPLLMVL